MKGSLLDTNVPSELTRPNPDARVNQWLEAADDSRLYLSVISLGEIVQGIASLPISRRRSALQQWLDETLRPWFAERILPVNASIAERWGEMAGERRLAGRQLKVADGLIAATGLEHDLTLVTRNMSDFENLGVTILNPWN